MWYLIVSIPDLCTLLILIASLSPVLIVMVIKNYDSNYFWSIIVDSIDVFDCAYKVWFCCMLHDVTVDIFFFLEMLLLERKVF